MNTPQVFALRRLRWLLLDLFAAVLAHVTVNAKDEANAFRLFTVGVWHTGWCASARSRRPICSPRALRTASATATAAECVSHAVEDALIRASRALLRAATATQRRGLRYCERAVAGTTTAGS